jgi:hypothetical protein
VHDFGCACAALEAAGEARTLIVLRLAPGAIHALGLGYAVALFNEARAAYPDVPHEAVIDCDDDAARAHRALTLGVRTVAFRGHPAARRRLSSVAAQLGATIVSGRTPRGACVLDDAATAATVARAFLARRPRAARLAKPRSAG